MRAIEFALILMLAVVSSSCRQSGGAPAAERVLGTYQDPVVRRLLGPALVGERVGADQLHASLQRAIDRVVVGRQLDRRRQAGTDEGHVVRRDPRLDQQRLVERHD